MIDIDFSTYILIYRWRIIKRSKPCYILWVFIFGLAIVKCEEAIQASQCIRNETNVSTTFLSLMLKNFLSIRLL